MIVTDDNERTPLKAAAGPPTSPVHREQQLSPPPPPYAAASHYPFPSPTHYGATVRPPIAPIPGVPSPVSYSPHSPLAPGQGWPHHQHAGLPAPHYIYTRRNVRKRTIKRFLGAYLTSILLLFFVGIFLGGIEIASTTPGRRGKTFFQYVSAWGNTFTIQFGKRHPECVCMPGTGPPSSENRTPSPLPIFPTPISFPPTPREAGDLFSSKLDSGSSAQ